MEYKQLGGSGLRVSKLCLGTMIGFDENDRDSGKRIIGEAMDGGINFFDTADCYSRGESEKTIGEALEETGRRNEAVIATKFGATMGEGPNDRGANRKHIIESCENSLRRLKTDYIDLYIIHMKDPLTPLDELMYTMDTLVRTGKTRYIGTSKHPVSLILESRFISEKNGFAGFVSEQTPFNLLDRSAENELIPTCERIGVGITPFRPIAGALLSGHYRPRTKAESGRFAGKTPDGDEWYTSKALEAVEKLTELAGGKGVSVAEMSLAWVMNHEGVSSAILGMRNLDYLRSGVKACEIAFTQEELDRIDEIVPPGTYASNFYEKLVLRGYRTAYAKKRAELKAK